MPGLLSTVYQIASCTAARASAVLWSCERSHPIRLSTSENVLLAKGHGRNGGDRVCRTDIVVMPEVDAIEQRRTRAVAHLGVGVNVGGIAAGAVWRRVIDGRRRRAASIVNLQVRDLSTVGGANECQQRSRCNNVKRVFCIIDPSAKIPALECV